MGKQRNLNWAAGAQKQDWAMNVHTNNALRTLRIKQESLVAMFVVPNSGKTVRPVT